MGDMIKPQFNRRELEILKYMTDGVDLELMKSLRDENDYTTGGKWKLIDGACDPPTPLEIDQVNMRLYRLLRGVS